MNEPMSIVVCLPRGEDLFDPEPNETAQRDVRLSTEWDADTGGVVGWSSGGWDALALAAAHPDLARLVIVSLPYPDGPLPSLDFEAVTAKTLLLCGTADPHTGNRHGTRWQRKLPNARLEMVPEGGHELLVPKWGRILSHLAPRRKAG